MNKTQTFTAVSPMHEGISEEIETYPVVWAGDVPVVFAARIKGTVAPLGFDRSREDAAAELQRERMRSR